MKTPVAVFAYNRPQHLHQALSALARCNRLAECQVFIYCDGAKSPEQAASVQQTRQIACEWAKKLNAECILQENNLGLARSIVGEVSKLCKQYGRVIVIEDDLVVSPDFLNYMVQALDQYQDEQSVYQISGYIPPVKRSALPDVFFLPMTTTWGWATWERAWQIFDWNTPDAVEQLTDPKIRKCFDLDGNYPYAQMLLDRLAGKNQSWGILWWWAVFKAGGFVLHPCQTLVWVGGWDGTGTHCGTKNDFDQPFFESFLHPRLKYPLTFPEQVTTHKEAFKRVKQKIKALNKPYKPPVWKKITKKIVKILTSLCP